MCTLHIVVFVHNNTRLNFLSMCMVIIIHKYFWMCTLAQFSGVSLEFFLVL